MGVRPAGYNHRVDGSGARGARRRAGLAVAAGAVVLAILGYASFEFAGHVTGAAVAPGKTAARQAPGRSQAARSATPARSARPAVTASATASASATPQAPRTIVPVRAVAFGPHGIADGDNPQIAARVLTNPASGWVTQWYATPDFGALKQGTGLLLDMGRTVTVATVRLSLGSLPGANLQLRLGAAPRFGSLPVAATATATRELLNLPLTAPVRARYVLVWFTRLPPDNAGTYQVLVHQVTVQGQP